MVHRTINETVLPGRRLGRHVHHDEQSREYAAKMAPKIVSVVHASAGLPLNQGSIGSCTGNALIGAKNSAPNWKTGAPVLTEADAVRLYELETRLEGRPYPPNDPGGSGLMVCKAAKQLGLISAYHHAFGLTSALRALVLRPVITGVDWFSSFDQPDPKTGLVKIAARATIRGGHEFVLDEIDAENELVGAWNSWGPSYGLGGKFRMSFATFGELLKRQGDVTVPVMV